MTPERLHQISAIFHQAFARSGQERDDYLTDACRGDDELHRVIESLLAQDPCKSVLASPVTLPSGSRIGAYELLDIVGVGGMGIVYRARDLKLQRDVALKVLPEAVDPERIARFRREATVLASLNHPNIGAIYGFEDSGDARALVLELVQGPTLADRIARGALPLDEALPIARQIAEALEAAHEQGIIHRDLKPANIKVRPDGTVKVLDFGLAKLNAPNATDASSMPPTITSPAMMTGVGVLLGTAAYMSPEQARGKPVDTRTDIWAFGCILYEMLTGRRAFDREDITDVLGAIVHLEPDWAPLPLALPRPVVALLHGCLVKDPRRRISHVSAVRFVFDHMSSFSTTDDHKAGDSAYAPRKWMLLAGALLIVAVSALATLYVRSTPPQPVVTRLDVVTPPTTDPYSFALSPDGRQLTFVANEENGSSRLWVRSLDQANARPLPGTEFASNPFWSPDSHSIGFFANGSMKRVDVPGGTPQVIVGDLGGRAGLGTWNRFGDILLAPPGGGGGSGGLVRVPATGGTPVEATRIRDGQTRHRFPQFLPDGRRFLFYAGGSPETRGVYLASLDGGEPTRVLAIDEAVAAYAPPGFLLYVSQGVLVAQSFDVTRATVRGDPIPVAQAVGSDTANFGMAFSVSVAGALAHRAGTAGGRQLVWLDRAGKVLATIGPVENTGLASPRLSPDGRQIAVFRVVEANADVWLIDVVRGTMSRFTFNPATDGTQTWSPDGSMIAFRSTLDRSSDLFVKAAGGATDERPLLVSPEFKAVQDWSPDGRFLLYAIQNRKTMSDLWVLPLKGDQKPFPVVQTSFDEGQGQFSPDGRWLAYASNETGRYEVYVRPFPSPGGKWQISTSGGIYPRWRRDGGELFYVTLEGQMMAAPIKTAPQPNMLAPGPAVRLFDSPIVLGGSSGIPGYNSRAQYDVAPDGRFLMVVAPEYVAPSPITIVLNWTAALKK